MNNVEKMVDLNCLQQAASDFLSKLNSLQQEYRGSEDCSCSEWKVCDYFNCRNNKQIDEEFQYLRFTFVKKVLSLLPLKRNDTPNRYFDLSLSGDERNLSCIFIDQAIDLDDELYAVLYDKCEKFLEKRDLNREFCLIVEFFTDPALDMNWSDNRNDFRFAGNIKWISLDLLLKQELGIDNFIGWLSGYVSEMANRS